MADPTRPDLSRKKLIRPDLGQKILTRTHHYVTKGNFVLEKTIFKFKQSATISKSLESFSQKYWFCFK